MDNIVANLRKNYLFARSATTDVVNFVHRFRCVVNLLSLMTLTNILMFEITVNMK